MDTFGEVLYYTFLMNDHKFSSRYTFINMDEFVNEANKNITDPNKKIPFKGIPYITIIDYLWSEHMWVYLGTPHIPILQTLYNTYPLFTFSSQGIQDRNDVYIYISFIIIMIKQYVPIRSIG